MAITKTLIEAIPTENISNQVEHWDLKMKYSQGTEGQADYLEVIYPHRVCATEPGIATFVDGEATTHTTITNFTELDKTAWSLAELTALCPTTQWDAVFASQYASIITSPRVRGTSDDSFVIPS
jgi:hypothetical protein